MSAQIIENNNNNNKSDDKWPLRQLLPWNQAQREYFLHFDSVKLDALFRAFLFCLMHLFFCAQESEEELDEQDEIELCKSTVCSVETYRVNACIKAENTWAVKYKVQKFSELNKRRKEECYKYMEEKQARLQELMHMKRYQEGRERRRLRLVDAYLERRHSKRVFEKMKSLVGVPDRIESAQDIHMYASVEYMDMTFGSMQSSETVIRNPAEPTPIMTTAPKPSNTIASRPNETTTTKPSKTTATKRGVSKNKANAKQSIVTTIEVECSSDSIYLEDGRFNQLQMTPDVNINEAEQSEQGTEFAYDDGADDDYDDEYTTEDELSPPTEIRFQKLDTPSQNLRSRRSTCQSQNYSEGQTYSQFERCPLVTSTQDL